MIDAPDVSVYVPQIFAGPPRPAGFPPDDVMANTWLMLFDMTCEEAWACTTPGERLIFIDACERHDPPLSVEEMYIRVCWECFQAYRRREGF